MKDYKMRHGSLFSGIGGFDLAADCMGWENVFHCENNEFGKKVLKHYWPEAISYHDIKETDFSAHRGTIDVLSGGFPCQPFSHAGKRLGTEDDRHLWPNMLNAIEQIKPRWVVGENVFGIVNWNRGMVFEQVHADLEGQGYKVQAVILPACGIDAPHKRERVFFIGYSGQKPFPDQTDSDSDDKRLEGQARERIQAGERRGNDFQTANSLWGCGEDCWKDWPTQSAIRGGDDGLPTKLDGITFPKWRTESIKAYGNAVVPSLVLKVFKTIAKFEQMNP